MFFCCCSFLAIFQDILLIIFPKQKALEGMKNRSKHPRIVLTIRSLNPSERLHVLNENELHIVDNELLYSKPVDFIFYYTNRTLEQLKVGELMTLLKNSEAIFESLQIKVATSRGCVSGDQTILLFLPQQTATLKGGGCCQSTSQVPISLTDIT